MRNKRIIEAFTIITILLLIFPQPLTYALGEEENFKHDGSEDMNEDIEELDEEEESETEQIDKPKENKDETIGQSNSDKEKITKDKIEVKETEKKGKYQDGDKGDHVKALKEDLVRLGFASWSDPTPVYGAITASAVEDFQAYYDLPVTGVADTRTREKIEEVLNPPYRGGDRGEPVVELKEKLVKLGFASWDSPSQFYGSVTEGVVKDFQEAYDLTADGVADEETLARLDDVLAEGKYQDGDKGDHVKALKEDLVRLGFASWSDPTPVYGAITASAVEDFQAYYDLPVTGVADTRTREKIEEVLNPPYRGGDRGEPVVELKEKLVKLGFASWDSPSQFYGSVTEGVVKDFQEAYDLTADGVADEETLARLDDVLAEGKYQDGDKGDHVKALKEDLVRLGFASWSDPTPVYGPITASTVEDFQAYYGLTVNGIANQVTLNKIKEILNSKYSNGNSGEHVVELKGNLTKLGFGNFPSNPSKSYGSVTEVVVRDFQEYYNLRVNGIADEITLTKIDEILSSPYQDGRKGNHIVELKKDLTALGFGNFPSDPSKKYGPVTKGVVKDFQKTYGLVVNGIADEVTLAKIEEMLSALDKTKYDITLGDAVNIQMEADPQTDSSYAWVSKSYIKNDKVTASELNVRKGPGTNYGTLGTLSKGKKVKILDEYNDWYVIEYSHNEWVHSSPSDVRYYLNPENFINDEKQQFQFLDLAKPSGASAKDLNKFLKGRGILEGKGQAFIDAAEEHDINDIYLISHALLETGNGTSKLAKGVKHKGKTVYNMYGIGAYDDCAVDCGAKKAYEEGWTSPEKAIIGGATFIGNSYIKAGQNTLYKMRWNPDAMANTGKTSHQYATDVGWASKQITTMYDLYQSIEDFKLQLDVPVYK